jgi:RNA polymerase sigma factor (sigma-70 family)
MSELYNAVLMSQCGDNEKLLYLCEKFKPLLKKYSYKLGYEDAYEDLLIYFIECIYKIPTTSGKFQESDMFILSYIKRSIYNAYIQLHINIEKVNYYEQTYDEFEYVSNLIPNSINEYVEAMFILDMERLLTNKEFILFKQKFILNLTDNEIAHQLKISRQAVNKKIKNLKEKIKKSILYL